MRTEEQAKMPDAEPTLVTRLRFSTNFPQAWRDDWRGTTRVMRYYGECEYCRRRCYAFDDGENDPRGALGDHALHDLADDDEPIIRACAICANEYDRYRAIMARHGKDV